MDLAGASVGLVFCGVAYAVFARPNQTGDRGVRDLSSDTCRRNGRLFTVYKFRTMQVWSEKRQIELLKHNEMTGHMFKIRDDPRITPLGRLLRNYT